jgi:hypothetical protein
MVVEVRCIADPESIGMESKVLDSTRSIQYRIMLDRAYKYDEVKDRSRDQEKEVSVPSPSPVSGP